MRKKKKQWCSCTPQYESCNPCEKSVDTWKPASTCKLTNNCKSCKKPTKKYVDCSCEDYESTCVEKCENLAKKAQELFDKASESECQATQTYDQAKECEKSAQVLSAKANNLLQKAKCNEKESKAAECKAKELMEKSDQLSQDAKCLFKEAEKAQNQADINCEKAKCLYEKAQELNKNAKNLYAQAMKCNEKALECFKVEGEKIKAYQMNSKKCEDMISKCNVKLDKCDKNVKGICDKQTMCQEDIICDKNANCGCQMPKKKVCNNEYLNCDAMCNTKNYCLENENEDDEIIYVEESDLCTGNLCSSYVNPMYNMAPMQYMGNMCNKYPSLDMPYMNPYMCKCQDMNDMWMNYYMMMQNMMSLDDM
ncbi:hypothetical protein CHF27_000475 [Romboutsia maritimum]|uniref:Uncharacterized protein n=1 Tax=Romboutsia maritimum TaxID=2020948 RepID=A0A371IW63_9FIRM|nr:hypothetical protein [Romboutsia maritimum]RDY24708.1 hypothetical protein CHF27_000475 [Romboutsia maritimum]